MTQSNRASQAGGSDIGDFRYDATRTNNPPAGIAPTYEVRERRKTPYAYDPHLDPQLVWAGKAEHTSFEVDVVSLHIHERISTRAILDAVRRPDPLQLSLFGETPLPADQQIEFYQHEVGWANRLILGDSLLVMNSLLVKEGMAGKVQMIYVDPPYGIKYASNFQPRIDRRDVKDKDEDLTREPEQIKAYRDTWTLGTHSYLTYLRDRLLLARELLTESGSIFVQISDENLHLVRCLLDEVLGRENFVAVIPFVKTTGKAGTSLDVTYDFLLWYAKDRLRMRYRQLMIPRGEETRKKLFNMIELTDGSYRRLAASDQVEQLSESNKLFGAQGLYSDSGGEATRFPFEYEGGVFRPIAGYYWRTTGAGLKRLAAANRIAKVGKYIRWRQYESDFGFTRLTALWTDTMPSGFAAESSLYSTQTSVKVVERCILMTTDPGDLVLDPTCGSGTTAWCAEKWGRRWITCDTSRVALAITRQRLMTARFDYYELKDPERGPAGGFIYDGVPHITLESIARNTEIDTIAAGYQPDIEAALDLLNEALGTTWKEWEVPRLVPHPAWPQAVIDGYWELRRLKTTLAPADQVRAAAILEDVYRQTGHRWTLDEVPDPVPPEEWPEQAKEAIRLFWDLKTRKRRAIDESIQRNTPRETLYDRPQVKRGVVRVSGPFTVEAIPVPAVEDPTQAPIPPFEEPVEVEIPSAPGRVGNPGGDYLTTMVNLLQRQGGVLFPGGKKLELANLRPLTLGYLHAEAEAQQNGHTLRVALSFGPRHGPVTAYQVQEAIPTAKLNGYALLIVAGFSFDPEAQALIQRAPVAGLQVHCAHIAPDVLVGDLLKTTRASQLFTVFGQPDVRVQDQHDGTYIVELRGGRHLRPADR